MAYIAVELDTKLDMAAFSFSAFSGPLRMSGSEPSNDYEFARDGVDFFSFGAGSEFTYSSSRLSGGTILYLEFNVFSDFNNIKIGGIFLDARQFSAAANTKSNVDDLALMKVIFSGADSITGGYAGDKLFGYAGDDLISGLFGNDSLNGGSGKDVLVGGRGQDTFFFNSSLSSSNVDRIVDFNPADDTLRLENTGSGLFNTIATGQLSSSAFKTITSTSGVVDSSDRIIYNKTTGQLFFDRDGDPAGDGTGAAAVLFAVLSNKPTISHADLIVV